MRPSHAVVRVLFLLVMLVLCSCAAGKRGDGAAVNWPERPYPTRIAWLSAASSPEDLGIGYGIWGTFWRKVAGGEYDAIGRPYGIHVDCRGRILVADSLKHGVHLFDREFKKYYFVGGGVLSLPIGIAEDENNTAYVTDSATGNVFRFNLGVRELTLFAQGLQRPTGIVFSPVTKLLYVTDTLAGQVVVYDRQGNELKRLGRPGHGNGEFNLPTDLAVDLAGRLYVTDPLNARIQIFNRDGSFLKTFGQAGDNVGYFGKPKGVAVNSEGHIYVCDALYDRIQVFDFQGRLLITFGSSGSGKGEFWMPSGISIDKDDNIYISDSFNGRIQLLGYVWLD